MVDSVLNQTFSNFELLLIDDGSTDKTSQICDEYSIKDARIRVIHKKNSGTSETRNVGIQEAKGIYIEFIDNDDYMFPENLEIAYQELHDYDLLICDYVHCIRENFENVRCDRPTSFNRIVATNINEIGEKLPLMGYKNGTIWNQFFKRDLLLQSGVKFRKIQSEDEMFSFEFLSKVSSISRITYSGYCFFHNPGSQGSSHKYIVEYNWIEKMEQLYDEIVSRFHINNMNFLHIINERIAIRMSSYILKGYYADTRKSYKERINRWNRLREDHYFNTKFSLNKLSKRNKILLYLCKYRLYYLLDSIILLIVGRKSQ